MKEEIYNPESPELLACERCSRLVNWRRQVARTKRRAYMDQTYWGKPVAGFGDPRARILILGLAPGAHGANRTGRMFTGDASGDFLFPALHNTGFANQPTGTGRDDGLKLKDLFITSALRCVPPDNVPLRNEVVNCRYWLEKEIKGLPNLKVVIGMGKIGHDAYLDLVSNSGHTLIKARHPFKHGHHYEMPDGIILLGTYHVSFRNTNSGRLTAVMFEDLLQKARTLAGL
jgi:uracil-DNA glycosylase